MVQTLTQSQYDAAINKADATQKAKLTSAFNSWGIKITQDATKAYQGWNIWAWNTPKPQAVVNNTQNQWNLSVVPNSSWTNVNIQQPPTPINQNATQISQNIAKKAVETPKVAPVRLIALLPL